MMTFPEKTLTQTQVCALLLFFAKMGQSQLKTSRLWPEVCLCFHLHLDVALLFKYVTRNQIFCYFTTKK